MALSFAGDFIDMLSRSRMLHVSGELGTGKTLLAFAVADVLLQNGLAWGVWTNIPHVFPKRHELTRTVIILDEAGEFMDARDSASEHQAFGTALRKLNSYLLTPSVNRVDKRAIPLEAYRLADLSFLDWWLYGYKSQTRKAAGWFLLEHPEDYFGLFDTRAMPDDDAGLTEAFNRIRPEKVIVKRKTRMIDLNK